MAAELKCGTPRGDNSVRQMPEGEWASATQRSLAGTHSSEFPSSKNSDAREKQRVQSDRKPDRHTRSIDLLVTKRKPPKDRGVFRRAEHQSRTFRGPSGSPHRSGNVTALARLAWNRICVNGQRMGVLTAPASSSGSLPQPFYRSGSLRRLPCAAVVDPPRCRAAGGNDHRCA